MCASIFVQIYIYLHTLIHISVYIDVYMHKYISVYIYIYILTYIRQSVRHTHLRIKGGTGGDRESTGGVVEWDAIDENDMLTPTGHRSRYGPQRTQLTASTAATPRYPQGRRQNPCRRAGPTQSVYLRPSPPHGIVSPAGDCALGRRARLSWTVLTSPPRYCASRRRLCTWARRTGCTRSARRATTSTTRSTTPTW